VIGTTAVTEIELMTEADGWRTVVGAIAEGDQAKWCDPTPERPTNQNGSSASEHEDSDMWKNRVNDEEIDILPRRRQRAP
jgi:hypothetical protein